MSLTTREILRRSPFSLTIEQINEFIDLAASLNITLDPFLHGSVYKKECVQNPEAYSESEQEIIFDELEDSYLRIFYGKSPSTNSKRYVATAGAPGSGKSEFLEAILMNENQNSVYLDPDQQILKHMHCYLNLVDNSNLEQAYKTFRDASNYINNFLMVWAIYKGYDILHGATNTDKRVRDTIFKGLKSQGYEISLHVFFANAAMRSEALSYRLKQKKFYQVTNTDATGKVVPVFERLIDAYLPYADKIQMYYNSNSYWLEKTAQQIQNDCKMFARFDRALDAKHVFLTKGIDSITTVLTLCNDVDMEVTSPEMKEQLIALFKSWKAMPTLSYSYFELHKYKILSTAAAVLTLGGIAVAIKSHQNQNKPS